MDIESRLEISFFENIVPLNEKHHIFLVRHRESGKICVKKILSVYNKTVYDQLKEKPVPGIPKIIALYEENNTLILIEEYISGSTLQHLLDEGSGLSESEIDSYICQLCDIVSRLHSFDPPIIHRDIKPSNVLITPSGNVFLIDFNASRPEIAKDEDTSLLGTKGYAAPEQYGFGSSDKKTDIYAIGMLINTLLWGEYNHVVFKNSKYSKTIAKCTQLNPSDRYKSVSAITRSLSMGQSKASSFDGFRRFLPPGFRSGNPTNIIVSLPLYGLTTWLCCTFESQNTSSASILVLERISCFIIFFSAIAIFSDYLGICRIMPLCRSNKKVLIILGRLIFAIASTIVTLLTLFFIEAVLR